MYDLEAKQAVFENGVLFEGFFLVFSFFGERGLLEVFCCFVSFAFLSFPGKNNLDNNCE